jgi:hypothetical protein
MIKKSRTPFLSIDNMFLEREDNFEDNSVTYSFFYGDKACRHLILDSPIAKKVAAYHLIQKDLSFVYENIKCLIERQKKAITSGTLGVSNENTDFLISKSLYQAAVISYGKCFASASGGKNAKGKSRGVKLEKEIIKDFPQAQREAHEYLMNTRNEYVAHGGATNNEQSLAFFIISPEGKIIPNIFTMEAHVASTKIEKFEEILNLIESLNEWLKEKQNQKSQVIIKAQLPKFDEKFIESNSVRSLKLKNLS